MAIMPSTAISSYLPNGMEVYFRKYVDVSTGGRVKMGNTVVDVANSWCVFKCTQCSTDIHINFATLYAQNNPNYKVPFELQEWLTAHRHVCEKYAPQTQIVLPVPNKYGNCFSCGWSHAEHLPLMKKQDVPNTGPNGLGVKALEKKNWEDLQSKLEKLKSKQPYMSQAYLETLNNLMNVQYKDYASLVKDWEVLKAELPESKPEPKPEPVIKTITEHTGRRFR